MKPMTEDEQKNAFRGVMENFLKEKLYNTTDDLLRDMVNEFLMFTKVEYNNHKDYDLIVKNERQVLTAYFTALINEEINLFNTYKEKNLWRTKHNFQN